MQLLPMPKSLKYDLSPKALEHWDLTIKAAESDNSISIFDVIGQDYWTGEGVTAKRISAALRSIGENNPVTVNINSPGGDMFEGLAIYSLFKEHKGKVTMKVLGLAASAASVIAMAGDEIQISRAGFLMIHNAWVVNAGNRHDMREVADWLEPFDSSMADIYAARTGIDKAEIQSIMDGETWIGGSDSIDKGFADSLLDSDSILTDNAPASKAALRMDTALAKAGMPRTERRKLMAELKISTHNATDSDTPCAISLMNEITELKQIRF